MMNEWQDSICYDDIQLVPYYSDLKSRSEADVSMHGYSLPVIMSPMDTVCTPAMVKLFYEMNMIPTMHRYFKTWKDQYHYLYDGLYPLLKNEGVDNHDDRIKEIIKATYFSVGSVVKYKDWIDKLLMMGVENFIVDMAHGDTEACAETCRYLKGKAKNVIAGNVATKSGFARLQREGVIGVRCGIGGGCFTPKMKTITLTGMIGLDTVKIGDSVVTHEKRLKKVTDIIRIYVNETLIRINKLIECTRNHEFHVLHENDVKEFLNTKNHGLLKWVAAEELTKDHYLIDRVNARIGRIFELEEFEYDGYVYDLTVEDDHSYNIFGFTVHNSICATRINTGFGVPTLTSIINCNQLKENCWLIADGGIKNAGDIVKAIKFGADFVMTGKLLAATDLAGGVCYNSHYEEISKGSEIFNESECENESDYKCLVKYRGYKGMASREARENVLSTASVEGHAGMIKYTGSTVNFLNEIKMNLQAALSYGGSRNWKGLGKVKVIRNSIASINEAATHLDINFS